VGYYERLAERVRAAGVEICDSARVAAGDPLGQFDREFTQIRMFHAGHMNNVDEIPDSCTLAHEFGYALSFMAGEQCARYLEIIDRPDSGHGDGEMGAGLSEADKALVFEEEYRAWEYGRRELQAVGFTEWSSFELDRLASLNDYRRRLALSA
jgi:hypothetical protein